MHILKRRSRSVCLLIFTLVVFMLSGCGTEETSSTDSSSAYASSFKVTKADQQTDESDDVIKVDLGKETQDSYTISDAGEYELSGSYDGQIIVDAEEQIVHIFLNNADIHCLSGPAIDVLSAGKVIITSLPDTENTLRDSGDYMVSHTENACIYSVSDLTMNGTGSLVVSGYYKDAVYSKDVVKIIDGHVSLEAKRDGIRANDGFYTAGSKISIQSEASGIRTTKTKSSQNGDIEIASGSISVIAGEYGIWSVGSLRIADDVSDRIKGVLGQLRTDGDAGTNAEAESNE